MFQSHLANVNDGLGRLVGGFSKYFKNHNGYRINAVHNAPSAIFFWDS